MTASLSAVLDVPLFEALLCDAEEAWPKDFQSIEETFNRCCFTMAYDVIQKLGVFAEVGDCETIASLTEKCHLCKASKYVLLHILRILCDEGVLVRDGHTWRCVNSDPFVDGAAESILAAARRFQSEAASFQWLARGHDGLLPFLQGKLFAEEVMFPMGDFKLVQEVYNTSAVYGFYARLAALAVRRLTDNASPHSLRMLEVGAGTGNGTENVLAQTNDRFAAYTYTDVAQALVQMGQRKLRKRGFDFMQYQTFDACMDPVAQGFEPASYDVILAVNVLHATDNVLEALRNLREVLRPGGVLILSEISPPANDIYRYMELTFGMLPSYASYEDTVLRKESPLLRPEQWSAALTDSAFSKVWAIPGDAWNGRDRGGVLIACR